MERAAFKKKFQALLTVNDPLKEIAQLYTKAVKSGALYIEGEQEDSYRLCKIVYYAILCEMCEQWRPFDGQNRKEAENMQLFL